jgi:hypothetical protein
MRVVRNVPNRGGDRQVQALNEMDESDVSCHILTPPVDVGRFVAFCFQYSMKALIDALLYGRSEHFREAYVAAFFDCLIGSGNRRAEGVTRRFQPIVGRAFASTMDSNESLKKPCVGEAFGIRIQLADGERSNKGLADDVLIFGLDPGHDQVNVAGRQSFTGGFDCRAVDAIAMSGGARYRHDGEPEDSKDFSHDTKRWHEIHRKAVTSVTTRSVLRGGQTASV